MMTPPPPPPPPPMDPHRMEANGRHIAKPEEQETRTFLITMNAVNLLTHFFLGSITFSAFTYAAAVKDFVQIGPWIVAGWGSAHFQHVYLCVIGYIVLMSQAIIVLNPYVGWGTYLSRPQKRIVHIAMQISGSALAITGSMLKMFDLGLNFNSAHAYLGFTAMILTIFSLFGGVLNLILFQSKKNTLVSLCHTCLGALTITIAFIALIVAFNDYYRLAAENTTANLSIAFSVLALVGILTLPSVKLFRRKL